MSTIATGPTPPQPPEWPEYYGHLINLRSDQPGTQRNAISALFSGLSEFPERVDRVLIEIAELLDSNRISTDAAPYALGLATRYGVESERVLKLLEKRLLNHETPLDQYLAIIRGLSRDLDPSNGRAIALIHCAFLNPSPILVANGVSGLVNGFSTMDHHIAVANVRKLYDLLGIAERIDLLELVLKEGDLVGFTQSAYLLGQLDAFQRLSQGGKVDKVIQGYTKDLLMDLTIERLFPKGRNHLKESELSELADQIRERGRPPLELMAEKLGTSGSRLLMLGLDLDIEGERDPLYPLAHDLIHLAKEGLLTHLAIASPRALFEKLNSGDFSEVYGLQSCGSILNGVRDLVEAERTANFLRAVKPYLTFVPYLAEHDPKRGEDLRREEEAAELVNLIRSSPIGMVFIGNESEVCKIDVSYAEEAQFAFGSLLVDRLGSEIVTSILYQDEEILEIRSQIRENNLSSLFESGWVTSSFAIPVSDTPLSQFSSKFSPASWGQAYDIYMVRSKKDRGGSHDIAKLPTESEPVLPGLPILTV